MIPPSAAPSDDTACDIAVAREQVLLVGAGSELFGVPLQRCREILEARSYTPIPGAGDSVCGLINLRGRLITVLDLGVWLSRAAASKSADHSILVLEHEGRRVGLAVERVVRIVSAAGSPIPTGEPLSPPFRLNASDLAGSGWFGSPVVSLLDPQAIFQPALGSLRRSEPM